MLIKLDNVTPTCVDVEVEAEELCDALSNVYDIDRILEMLFEQDPYDWRDVQTWVEGRMQEDQDCKAPYLKNCPFCGSSAYLRQIGGGDDPDGRWYVKCTDTENCRASGDLRDTKVEATAHWNKRV